MKLNVRTKTLVAVIILIMMILINTIALAAETGNYSAAMSLTSNSKLKEGDTVNVTINFTNINAGDGVDSISGRLNYDENVFEVVAVSNFVGTNGWTPSYVQASKKLTFVNSSGNKVTSAGAVATISLKVKSSINVESTEITISEIKTSGGLPMAGGTGDISVNDISVTISKATEPANPAEKPENNVAEEGTVKNDTDKNNTIKDNTVTKSNTLPKTGIEQYGIVAIVVVAIVAIFSYALYKKIAKNVK